MNFGQAIEAMKIGKRVTRAGWNGQRMYLFISTILDFDCDTSVSDAINDMLCLPTVTLKTAQETLCFGWVPSQADMLAEDWAEVKSASPCDNCINWDGDDCRMPYCGNPAAK